MLGPFNPQAQSFPLFSLELTLLPQAERVRIGDPHPLYGMAQEQLSDSDLVIKQQRVDQRTKARILEATEEFYSGQDLRTVVITMLSTRSRKVPADQIVSRHTTKQLEGLIECLQ